MQFVAAVLTFVLFLPLVRSDTPVSPLPEVGLGATYYVDAGSGDDANAGRSPDRAWRTIQRAADTAQAGETVAIRGGTYREGVLFQRHSGREGAPIVFRAYPGETVVVSSPEWYGLYLRANWIIIDGLQVQGSASHGLFVSGAHHNVIEYCAFSGHGWAGVMIAADRGPTSRNVVQHCAIHDNGHEGVYVRSGYWGQPGVPVTGNAIADNAIYRNGSEGIQNTATFAPPAPSGTVIRGNHVFENGGWAAGACLEGDGLLVEGNVIHGNGGDVGGIWYSGDSGSLLRNNVIHGNHGCDTGGAAGIYLHSVARAGVDHNTIHGNAGAGILVAGAGPDVAIRNNILSGNGDQLRIMGGEPTIARNLIDGDSSALGADPIRATPSFNNPGGGDLRLTAGSAAVDTGVLVGVTRDADGVPRPQGDGYDLGAYERAAR